MPPLHSLIFHPRNENPFLPLGERTCFHLKRQQRLNLNKSLVGEISRKMVKGKEEFQVYQTKLLPGRDLEEWLWVSLLFSPLACTPILNRFASQGFCSVFMQFIHRSPPPCFLTHSAEIGSILYDMAIGIFFLLGRTKRTPFKSDLLIIISTRFPEVSFFFFRNVSFFFF